MADKNYVGVFNFRDDPAMLGTRWTRWLASFELFADSRGLIMMPRDYTNRQQRRAQLLHFAGPDVQDIFLTLPNTGTVRDYDAAVTALNAYFIPKVNPAYARYTFRQMTQRPGDTVRQFVTRLWTAANICDYGTDTKNQIRDEVLCKCNSDYLRRKLLEVGPDFTLTRALELAGQCEELDTQMSMLSLDRNNTVAAVSPANNLTAAGSRKTQRHLPDRKPWQNDNMNNRSYRCGKEGHFGRDQCFPARGKTCNLCNGKKSFLQEFEVHVAWAFEEHLMHLYNW